MKFVVEPFRFCIYPSNPINSNYFCDKKFNFINLVIMFRKEKNMLPIARDLCVLTAAIIFNK